MRLLNTPMYVNFNLPLFKIYHLTINNCNYYYMSAVLFDRDFLPGSLHMKNENQ